MLEPAASVAVSAAYGRHRHSLEHGRATFRDGSSRMLLGEFVNMAPAGPVSTAPSVRTIFGVSATSRVARPKSMFSR